MMSTIHEASAMVEMMARGARCAAAGSLEACALDGARRALRLCEVVAGAWRKIPRTEEFVDSIAIEWCVEQIADDAVPPLTDAEVSDATWERSEVDREFVRLVCGRRVLLVQIDQSATCNECARTSYHLRLEGTR